MQAPNLGDISTEIKETKVNKSHWRHTSRNAAWPLRSPNSKLLGGKKLEKPPSDSSASPPTHTQSHTVTHTHSAPFIQGCT